MSDAMRTLRDSAKRVRELHNDLQPPVMAQRDWKAEVYADHSLGGGARKKPGKASLDESEEDSDQEQKEAPKVELWFLAQHFLLAWHDWHTMRIRFLRYFGFEDHESPFPKAWKRLDERCFALAVHLIHNKDLEEFVANDWLMTGTIHSDHDDAPSLRDVVHVVIQNHRRWYLMRNAAVGILEPQSRGQATIMPPDQSDMVWQRCLRLVRRLNDETVSACTRFADGIKTALPYHLRRYRYTNLLMSWLDELHEDGDKSPGLHGSRSGNRSESYPASRSGSQLANELFELGESALTRLLSEKIVPPSINDYLSRLNENARETAGYVLNWLSRAIAEVGYDDCVEDVASGPFRHGPRSLFVAGAINLIPSEARGECRPLLLAVSKGDKKAVGFTSVMRAVRKHLIDCPATQAVIVLCDYWHPGMLEEHLEDLRAHHRRGVNFLFLMAGVPGRSISPVAVDLGLTS